MFWTIERRMNGSRIVLTRLVIPVLALLTAFLLGGVVIALTDFDHLKTIGTDPIGAIGGAIGTVIRSYGAMLSGAIGDPGRILTALQSGNERDIARAIRPLTEGLLSATPLIFLGLGVSVAFRAGLFNLGSDGQFLIGGLGAVIGANALAGVLPSFVILLAALAMGTLFGAAYGFLPGLLKARTGAHEFITTLMLNTIAAEIVIYVTHAGGFSRSLHSIASVPLLVNVPTIRLDWGFVAALVTAAVVSFVSFRTRLGFEMRATGFSRTVARTAGMRPDRVTILAMSMSGGLAGMGGAFLTLGPAGGLSGSGEGLVPLALALIAGLRPSGIVGAAILYGALGNGAKSSVIATGVPLDVLVMVIAFAMMFVAAPGIIRSIWRLPVTESQPERAPLAP
jgi:simple sugar transport system permease protein